MDSIRDRKTLREAATLLDKQAAELALRMPVERGAASVAAEDQGQHDQCRSVARRLRIMAKR